MVFSAPPGSLPHREVTWAPRPASPSALAPQHSYLPHHIPHAHKLSVCKTCNRTRSILSCVHYRHKEHRIGTQDKPIELNRTNPSSVSIPDISFMSYNFLAPQNNGLPQMFNIFSRWLSSKGMNHSKQAGVRENLYCKENLEC